MTDEEHKWIETNNSVCALLRQAHDVLAISSLPPKRTWVGLTDEEMLECNMDGDWTTDRETAKLNVQAKLKEKNT
jgi:hypothetical protein